ncbi:MAG TPA: iron-containing alcohol dehydrogenase, partial [Deltaproteobacteria bacterium]|nr:iron-containing alcohol dehydrogenase [Deltaproteobacteria bacterium]
MVPLRKPLLRTLKTALAYSMYLIPPQESEVMQGAGSIRKLPALMKARGVRKPLIVTDSILMELGLLKGLITGLDAIGMPFALFDGVQPNPTI